MSEVVVITPASRPDNWDAIRRNLEQQRVTWVPIVATEELTEHPAFQHSWIEPIVFAPPDHHDPPYWKTNRYVERGVDDDTYYHVLCDDSFVFLEFYDNLRKSTYPIVIACAIRTDSYGAPCRLAPGQHSTAPLMAEPGNMRHGHITLEQLIIRGDILRQYRFDEHNCGADGILAERLYRDHSNQIEYRHDLILKFNAMQPDRYHYPTVP
jgi:hypothetical protein